MLSYGAYCSDFIVPIAMSTVDTSTFKILLDVPGEENLALGFNELSLAFSEIIRNSDPRFAIGLFGGWGSGKTTLMRAIESRLVDTDQATTATVWFSAWRYEKEAHLIVPLLDVIREAVVAWAAKTPRPKAKAAALRLASTIGKVSISLLAGFSLKAGLPGVLDASFDANKALTRADAFDAQDQAARTPRSFYHAAFSALKDAFAEFHKSGAARIVVFVDDLDRCLPEGALEVMESMKLFFDLDGFVFVVGLDRQVVEMSVEHRYRELQDKAVSEDATRSGARITGDSYLRKIFQVPYSLAPVSSDQLQDFLFSVKEQSKLPLEQKNELDTEVMPFLSYLITESGFNPREFKRFINGYTLQRMINPSLDPTTLLALQTIAFRPDWADIQTALLAFRDGFMRALEDFASDCDATKLEPFLTGTGPPPGTFLDFINAGGPGNPLLTFLSPDQHGYVSSIDDYLFSGEASRSTESSDFLGAFVLFGNALKDTRDISTEWETLPNELNRFASVVGDARRRFTPTSNPMFRAAAVLEGIEIEAQDLAATVAGELTSIPTQSNTSSGNDKSQDERERQKNWIDRAKAATEKWRGELRRALSDLQGAYRAGL